MKCSLLMNLHKHQLYL